MGGVEDFRKALVKYGHFFKHMKLDRSLVLAVEEAQQEVMREAYKEVDVGEDLSENIKRLSREGLIDSWARRMAEAIGEEPRSVDVWEALSGDLDKPGVRPMLLALQAVARAYADKLLERGVGYEPSARCPVCGLESRTMVKRGRFYNMICHFCGYEWRVSDKIVCPYCGSRDPVSIGVFSDKARRVALARCQDCGSTWRIIMDEAITAPRILLPLIALKAEAYRSVLEGAGNA